MGQFSWKRAIEAGGYHNKSQDPDHKQNMGELKQKIPGTDTPFLEHLHCAQQSCTESPLP